MLESKSYIATPPGAAVREQLDDRGMTQKEFARRMGMSEKHISKLVNGEVHLTPDVAERLELVLGIPADFWNKLEAIYREKLAKVNHETKMEEEISLAQKYPYNKLEKWGMVPRTRKPNERAVNLCRYFEVSSLKLLQNGELMPVACRKLADTEKSTYIMRTLVQYARRRAREIDIAPFSRNILKRKVAEMRNLTTHETMDFEESLVDLLRSCGVALVYLPPVSGSFLHGITFYDRNKIVMGITMRGKYADKFWFSFFHEISHILRGDIYKKEGTSEKEERAADSMAAEFLIPSERLDAFCGAQDYSIGAVRKFADSMGISAGIVIGRLQNDKKLRYDQLNNYKIQYEAEVL
jgi:HTH-type transcriptional regulator/antitoxin HigA